MAREQTALLRVATLVANGVSAKALADAVTAEVGVLLGVDLASMWRVHPDDTTSAIALWAASGDHPDVSGRWPLEDLRLMSRMRRSGVPTREDEWETAEGPIAAAIRGLLGARSSVASPIVVENRLWGVLIVHSTTVAHLPADTEQRLGAFTALVSTAIANAQARSDLEALADEQAALRRVATLVAGQSPPAETLRQIAEEMGTLLRVDGTAILRYETDGTATVTAGWGEPDMTGYVGERLPFDGDNPAAYVFETGQPARETYTPQSRGPLAQISRQVGITSAAAGRSSSSRRSGA
jgi:GAF domain-containing protein